jgi:hypothetical protein
VNEKALAHWGPLAPNMKKVNNGLKKRRMCLYLEELRNTKKITYFRA